MPDQKTVDYPSFKLVIVGDGGTGMLFFSEFSFNIAVSYLMVIAKQYVISDVNWSLLAGST